ECKTGDVGVKTAAQTLIGGNQHDTDCFDILAFNHVRVMVVGMCLHKVSGDFTHLGGIGTAGTHSVLRLAHFRCRHHLHGFGDLPRVLHAFDLGSNFLDSGHRT